jgi:hypothetical protein
MQSKTRAIAPPMSVYAPANIPEEEPTSTSATFAAQTMDAIDAESAVTSAITGLVNANTEESSTTTKESSTTTKESTTTINVSTTTVKKSIVTVKKSIATVKKSTTTKTPATTTTRSPEGVQILICI